MLLFINRIRAIFILSNNFRIHCQTGGHCWTPADAIDHQWNFRFLGRQGLTSLLPISGSSVQPCMLVSKASWIPSFAPMNFRNIWATRCSIFWIVLSMFRGLRKIFSSLKPVSSQGTYGTKIFFQNARLHRWKGYDRAADWWVKSGWERASPCGSVRILYRNSAKAFENQTRRRGKMFDHRYFQKMFLISSSLAKPRSENLFWIAAISKAA